MSDSTIIACRKRAGAVVLAMSFLAGCGSSTPVADEAAPTDNLPVSQDADSGADTTATSSPDQQSTSSTYPGQVTYAADGTFETADGYRYGVAFEAVVAPWLNPADEKPGSTRLETVIMESSWRIVNLLPERNAPSEVFISGGKAPSIYALFTTDRPVCRYIRFTELPPIPGINGSRCRLTIGSLIWTPANSREASGGIPAGSALSGKVHEDTTFNRLAEAEAQAVLDDLTRGPDETAVVYPIFSSTATPGAEKGVVEGVSCDFRYSHGNTPYNVNLLYVFEGTRATDLTQVRC